MDGKIRKGHFYKEHTMFAEAWSLMALSRILFFYAF